MSRAWIFQCNPERFNLEAYLEQSDGDISWLVTRYSDQIAFGDTVYLWRSGEDAGIVAQAEISGPIEIRPDDPDAQAFWTSPQEGNERTPRVRLKLKRVVGTRREVIRRDWLRQDPQLRNLSIVKMPTGTNFPVAPELASRLFAIWSNTGRDWTYAEVVAALWAYEQVWDKTVSKLEGSPVDQVSKLINRVVTGVYNKLMNFRSLDSRVATKGFSGTSAVDKEVWAEFFDIASQTIRGSPLRVRFEELWPESDAVASQQPVPEEVALREALDDEVARLDKALKEKSLQDLMKMYAAQNKKPHPRRRPSRTNAFDRDSLVVLITKRRASFTCEVPTCSVLAFEGKGKHPYVETHHLVPLADGGEDRIENTACLCAQHHREVHVGKNRAPLTRVLQALRAEAASIP